MLTLKTAIGIAVRGADLEFLCLKRGLRGLLVAEWMRMENYRALRPAEAGLQYQTLLRRQGLKAANAVVALPRADALLRVLALPAEAERTLAQAIEYQVDSLHPFEEGGVYYDFAILQRQEGRIQVAVVMAEKKASDGYSEWFAEAGIPVAGFTVSAAALYAATAGHPGPLVVADFRAGSLEVLGFSSAALFSKEVELPRGADPAAILERELAFCRAEMRLAPEAQPRLAVTGEPPGPLAAPAGFEPAALERLAAAPEVAAGAAFRLAENFAAYAAALAALDGRAFRVNLLPEHKRVYRSPWTYAPTYALAALVVLLGLALAARGAVQDRLYLSHLNREIGRLEAQVKYVEKLETQHRGLLDHLLLLEALKNPTTLKMQALAELTRVLPPAVWLQEADLRDDTVIIAGQAASAAELLSLLDASPYFRNAEFLSSISKSGEGKEFFRLRMRLETILPAASGAPPQGARP